MTIVAHLFNHPSDRLAAIVDGKDVSYGQLCADIDRGAAYLRSQGIGPGSTVGIHLGPFWQGDDYASWVAHLAAIRIGATHASVHDRRLLSELIELTKVDAVIGKLPDAFDAQPAPKVIAFDLQTLPTAQEVADDEAQAVRLNLTSGTTGKPKLIRWDARMIAARVDQLSDLGVINADTCLDSYLSPRTTAGFRYPVATWRTGGGVLLSGGGRYDELDRAMRSTLCICSPFQLQWLRSRNVHWPQREARTIVALGGRVAPGLRDWALANLAAKIIICYGSTETGNVAHGDASIVDRDPGSVGWLRKGAEVQIVDADGQPVSPGKAGTVRIRTELMAFADGDENSRESGWFEPGDVGVMFEDGLLAIAGRSGDVVNIGGVKVSAAEIESKLLALDGVEDATAGVVPMPAGDTLWIAVVPRPGVSPTDVAEHIKPMLSRGVPFRVVAVSAIPRNSMGKVNRRLLIEQARKHLQARQQPKREHA
ncbi:MAG TPA: class I adenylate-forming enzyme family protein [Sphingomicrobium sp.]